MDNRFIEKHKTEGLAKQMMLNLRLPLLPCRAVVSCLHSKMSTSSGPITRKFIPLEHSQLDSTSETHGSKLRLVSYNILAQAYVKSSLFPHSPAPCLKWKARCQELLTVLRSFEADILCLQEVDEYDTFYKGNVESHGYSSVYIQRSGTKRDGCGIFYRNNKLELVMEEKIDYNDLVNSVQGEEGLCADMDKITINETNRDTASKEGLQPKDTKDRGDPKDPRVRLKRDCVGIMTAFRLKECSEHLVIVANTHIYWDPEWADVKLAQVKYLLSRLTKFKTLVSDKFDSEPSVLLSGDFNSVPGDKVYQYLISGSSSVEPRLEQGENLPIPLNSVYASLRGEPLFTNCTPGFTATLDYIFFSPSGIIKPISYLDLPEADSSDVKGGLPNYNHPSDHLPIEIDELSPRVTLEDIAIFFSYCGTVDSIQLQRSSDKTGIAYVTFRQPYAYRTALLLNGAVIIDNPIRVLPYQDSTTVPVIDTKYEIRYKFDKL